MAHIMSSLLRKELYTKPLSLSAMCLVSDLTCMQLHDILISSVHMYILAYFRPALEILHIEPLTILRPNTTYLGSFARIPPFLSNKPAACLLIDNPLLLATAGLDDVVILRQHHTLSRKYAQHCSRFPVFLSLAQFTTWRERPRESFMLEKNPSHLSSLRTIASKQYGLGYRHSLVRGQR